MESHWDEVWHPDCGDCQTYQNGGFGQQACGPCMDSAREEYLRNEKPDLADLEID